MGWPAGGSKKNPRLNPYDGTVVEIRNVPRTAADRAAAVDDDVTVIETDEPPSKEELSERRDQSLDDLRTINGLLDEHAVPSAEPLRCRCGRHECPPEGYTVTEIAELVGVTANTVSAWCRTEALAAHRVGGRWIVPEPLPEYVGRTRIPSQHTARMPPDPRLSVSVGGCDEERYLAPPRGSWPRDCARSCSRGVPTCGGRHEGPLAATEINRAHSSVHPARPEECSGRVHGADARTCV
ncbi:helix-turn-helix domain-containing protein [Streptomyces lydicus]|uniref:helix-turn-helix domain-containing protein n=1 Tax=Streptomyces lydicus TaxID=47763 RepID=UPI0037909EBD